MNDMQPSARSNHTRARGPLLRLRLYQYVISASELIALQGRREKKKSGESNNGYDLQISVQSRFVGSRQGHQGGGGRSHLYTFSPSPFLPGFICSDVCCHLACRGNDARLLALVCQSEEIAVDEDCIWKLPEKVGITEDATAQMSV